MQQPDASYVFECFNFHRDTRHVLAGHTPPRPPLTLTFRFPTSPLLSYFLLSRATFLLSRCLCAEVYFCPRSKGMGSLWIFLMTQPHQAPLLFLRCSLPPVLCSDMSAIGITVFANNYESLGIRLEDKGRGVEGSPFDLCLRSSPVVCMM